MGLLCTLLDQVLPDNFLAAYLLTSIGAALFVLLSSGGCFHWLYTNASFQKWQYKSNANFPSPTMVRQEVTKTMMGVAFTTAFPALSLYARHSDWMQGYCYFISYERHLLEFVVVVCATDFVEWLYHWAGHRFDCLWQFHRNHHAFYNPTPWAVIADEPMDNCIRACPMFFLPLLMPINLEVLVFTFVVFFYMYGIYLHSGYEADFLVRSDHPLINTSVQHYLHHATGGRKDPCHTGFFFKGWDYILGTYYKQDVTLEESKPHFAITQRAEGKRSDEAWSKVRNKFPNYSLLLKPGFWLDQKNPKWEKQMYLDLSSKDVQDVHGGVKKEN